MVLIRSLKAVPRTPLVFSDWNKVIPLAQGCVTMVSAIFNCLSGTLEEVEVAESVDIRGVPHQHPTLAEEGDGNVVWLVSVSTVDGSPLVQDCHYTGCGQGLVQDVFEGCIMRQAFCVSPAGQVVVAQPVTHASTTILVELLDGCAYTQPNMLRPV